MKKLSKTTAAVFLTLVLVVSVFGLPFMGEFSENTSEPMSETEKKEAINQLTNISKIFIEVAAEVKPAVVNINTEINIGGKTPGRDMPGFDDPFFDFFFNPNVPRKSKGLGSGFIISEDGYILTNYHVIKNAEKINVRLSDKREYDAKLIGTDEQSDIAVIKIEDNNLPTVKLGNSDKIQVGEWVIAVGSPFSFDFSVTAGIISALSRSGVTGARYENYIQTDAAINPGNSGGPLVNLNGEVVGINTAIVSRSGGFQGLGFAIPINFAKEILPQLIEHGQVKHGMIGISVQPLDKELAEKFKLKTNNGVIINEVFNDTPAQKSGLKTGDIILSVNDSPVDSPNDLIYKIGIVPVGEKVDLDIFREGKNLKLSVEVIERDEQVFSTGSIKGDKYKDPKLGITVANIDEELAERFSIPATVTGVVVISIKNDSPVRGTGLTEGDVIAEIDRKSVSDISDYKKASSHAELANGVLLLIKHQGISKYIVITKK